MASTNGAVPLLALDAVGFDTETTGLDTAVARIVQIGAVAIARGQARAEEAVELLVDPGIAIPSSATAIHGVTNAMVRNAPAFPGAWQEVRRFVGDRVMIGHSIGFDLAVIEKEAARAGLEWVRPRTLCVRLLASIANPRLPDNSLETIASWLDVSVAVRHRALGDAITAAQCFVRLLPKLAERGVRTLAEAERACLQLTEQLENHHRAGWAEPVLRPGSLGRGSGALDPYAYSHRIADLMSSPPLVVRDVTTLRDAVDLMVERRVSSLFVSAAGETGAPLDDYGIVTERDVMRLVAADGPSALETTVSAIATRPLVSIRAAAFVYRAIGRMDRLKIRHLAVRDTAGRLAGVVSARDLLKLRATAAISLTDEIEAARSAPDMAAAWSRLPAVAGSLIADAVEPTMVAAVVSEELCGLTRRAAELAEAEMLAAGMGRPPCAYSIMVLGSAGRAESLLAPDQDNALVYGGGEANGAEDLWFADFGKRVATMLDTAGVPLCKGGVMAMNAEWRGSSETWKQRIGGWIGRSRPEDLLNVDIFFDMLPVHGDTALAHDLFEHAYEEGSHSPHFAKLLGERLAARGSPFTLLGGFQTENGRIDLKMHGLFPAVALARTLAIRHDLRLHSTRERLDALIGLGIGGEADLARIARAHALVVRLTLAQQSRDLMDGIPVSNRVEIAALTRDDQSQLKAALKTMQIAPDLARALMFR